MQRWRYLPVYGILIFLGLYFYASILYPGGSVLEPNAMGFSWINNYWCDLLAERSPSGAANPAKYVAIASMLILSLSLCQFWILVSRTFPGPGTSFFIGAFGSLAMLAASAVFTPYHDILIYCGCPLGFIAFLYTVYQIRNQKWGFWLALIAAVLALINFSLWHYKMMLNALPLIQKFAFAGFFTWVIFLTWQMDEETEFIEHL